jgi:P4 family phage/plasmid primase-like protien
MESPPVVNSTQPVHPVQGPDAEHFVGAGAAPVPDTITIHSPLLVTVNGNEQAVDTADLLDKAFAGDLVNTCKDAAQPPVFDLRHLLDWPDEERWGVLMLIKDLAPHCLARASAAGEVKADVFGVVLSLMMGPTDVVRCERGRRGAIEAAALFHGNALQAASTVIAQKLKELGVKGVLPQKIHKEARNVAGKVEQGRRDPQAAARAFLADLRERAGLGQGDRPLHYYRDDFYLWAGGAEPWEGGRWRRLDDEVQKAQLTAYLQNDDQVGQVTDRLVRDVLTNLKGLALLDVWDEEMSFFVGGVSGDGTPTVTRPRFVVFGNGMVELDEAMSCLSSCKDDTPKLYETVPDYFTVNRLPFNYDLEAWCPLWEETLDDVLPRQGPGDHRREVLQEFMGWTLLAGDMTFQKFLILVGGGNNGKSTILEVWEALLGPDNVSHVPLNHLDGEFRICEMAGKLANIAGDMTRLDRVEEGVLKQLTSGDPMQVNRKNKRPVTMRPVARLVFATNTLPSFCDRSDGVWRRIIAIPFTRRIPENQIDGRLPEKLLKELPGIFNWALAGAVRLLRQGRFTDCAVCSACVEEHRTDSDPFKQFADEWLLFGPEREVRADLLYEGYAGFCKGNGRLARCSSEVGKQVLRLPGVGKRRKGGGSRLWVYTGVALEQSFSPWG